MLLARVPKLNNVRTLNEQRKLFIVLCGLRGQLKENVNVTQNNLV